MKIYTRTGDEGQTGLFGGGRVGKDDLRIACYGEVDELNACLGLAREAAPPRMAGSLRREMARLFVLGAHLSTPPGAAENALKRLPGWDAGATAQLEREIDRMEADLEPLQNFILPGGCDLSARLHLARTVCRRAERTLTALAAKEEVDPQFCVYVNRLSDWIFTTARQANRDDGVADVPWDGK